MNSTYELPEIPWSNEAEQSLIGSLLLDNNCIDRAGRIDPSDFYSGSHQEIIRHILRLLAANKPVDIVTVLESLQAAGRDEYAGGIAYLGEIANNTASTASVARYAEIVRDKSMLRRLQGAGSDIQSLTNARDGMSVSDKVQRAQALVMELAELRGGDNAPKLVADYMPQWLDRFTVRSERAEGAVVGMPTHIASIDAMYSGLEDGRVYLIAGRPGMGKSTLAQNIAEGVAIHDGNPVLICSQEMPGVEMTQNLIASVGRIDKNRLRGARLNDDEYTRLEFAASKLQSAPLMIDEQGSLRMSAVMTKARQAKRQMGGLRLLVVDYLQLMAGDGDNQNAIITAITQAFKALAMEMSIPILLLSQLNRKCEERPNKRPVSADLRDSGAIEQDADVIWFVYRDEIYNPDSMDKGMAELICTKDRVTGNTGKTLPLVFHGEYGRFESLEGGLPSWDAPKEDKRRYKGMD